MKKIRILKKKTGLHIFFKREKDNTQATIQNEWLRNQTSGSSERQQLLWIHQGGDDSMEMVGHKLDIDGMENFI